MIWDNDYEKEQKKESAVRNSKSKTTTTTNNPFLRNTETFVSEMTTKNTLLKGLSTITTTSSSASSIINIQDTTTTTTTTTTTAAAESRTGIISVAGGASENDNITAVTVASTTIKLEDGGGSKCITDNKNEECDLDAKLVLLLQKHEQKNNALFKDNTVKEMAMIKPTIHNNNNNNNNYNNQKTNENNNLNYNVEHLMDNFDDNMTVVSCDESSALSESTENGDDDDDTIEISGVQSNTSTLQGPLNIQKISISNSAANQPQQQQTTYQYIQSNWSNNNIKNNNTNTVISMGVGGLESGGDEAVPQTTEGFLSSLGVDISGLCTNTNNAMILQQQQQQSAKQLTSTFLTDKINNAATNLLANSNFNMNSANSLDVGQLVDGSHDGQAKIMLICERNSHPFQSRTIIMTPNMEYKVGRLIAKSRASENNAIFDCKVLSRNHAVLWYTAEDQKFWVKDTKSSNGTFINEQKLGLDAAELHFGDIVKFGVEVVENTRKEIHGCIIASVKLYLPDGREAISIDSVKGEKFIAYDELHRLNQFIQELMQREKNLKSTLFNIQNILDATRKNSGLCWQALIAEDQLLHRIHMYEKKLQIMDKNMPENSLRNEILQLMEEKNSYQQAAKETLRKVYQERCEAMQLLAKMESAYAQSENECQLLREQIMSGKQCLQDVSNRLLQTEADFMEYKKDVQLHQQDAKEQEDSQLSALVKTLRERETECENFKETIDELQKERTALIDESEKCKALNQLDAVIADVAGTYDSYDMDKSLESHTDSMPSKMVFNGGMDVVQLNNNKNEEKLKKCKSPLNKNTAGSVFQLFKNSDLCNNEEVMKAICNEQNNASDSSDDETDMDSLPLQQFMPIKSKNLQSVYNNLLELEAHIENEAQQDQQMFNQALKKPYGSSDETIADMEKDHDEGNTDYINEVLAKKNKSHNLLKNSVALLRDAYNDIIMSSNQKQEPEALSEDKKDNSFSDAPIPKLEHQITLKEEDQKSDIKLSDNCLRELEEASKIEEIKAASALEVIEYRAQIAELMDKMQNIEMSSSVSIENLNTESDALKKQLLDLMCELEQLRDEKKALEESLTKCAFNGVATNSEEIETETHKINTGSVAPTESTIPGSITGTRSSSFEQNMHDELYMDAVATEREEELIVYKDNFNKLQNINLELRNEITELKSKTRKNVAIPASQLSALSFFLRYILPYGIAAFAIYLGFYSYF